MKTPPILRAKRYRQPSYFKPRNLLREARRQKGKTPKAVPPVCVLDPDGDVTAHLAGLGRAAKNPDWACYHTELYDVELEGRRIGLLPLAVGAPFAVLVAEQLFASGCRLLVSVTSAGSLDDSLVPPCFILIGKALRDEGTSYHYLPPGDFSSLDAGWRPLLMREHRRRRLPVLEGAAWTTDAPYRETAAAIAEAKRLGLRAVEMEAAALYAFAEARSKRVVCYAFVTNRMAADEGDFEKGDDHGAGRFLEVVAATARAVLGRPPAPR